MAIYKSAFLVLGSGITGLSLGLKAASFGTVNIVTKKKAHDSNTNYAQGGIAAVLSKTDKFQYHIQDTHEAGAGLCHKDSVELIVSRGPDMIRRLVEWGANFNLEQDGSLELGREGGHSQRRIVHSRDLTGREIENCLLDNIKKISNAVIFQYHFCADLILDDSGRCWGAWVWDEKKREMHMFLASVTIVCTGGSSRVYYHSTNPNIATGDGVAMAYRAGATIANMEFMQFHPTAFHVPADEKPFLISEAVRGEGGILRTSDHTAFMEKYHPMKDLAPRDIVARAIDVEMKTRGEACVYLDVSHLSEDFFHDRFPYITEYCLSKGVKVPTDFIPVVPAAHYTCGGIVTNIWGCTGILGLFAAGEVACTGVHGANRLASNSLLEALVFAEQALNKSTEDGLYKEPPPDLTCQWDAGKKREKIEAIRYVHCLRALRTLLWDYVGIVRTNSRLAYAKKRFQVLKEEIDDYYEKGEMCAQLLELRNLAQVAELIINCAINRQESRGLHFNQDYPAILDTPEDTQIWKDKDGNVHVKNQPIP